MIIIKLEGRLCCKPFTASMPHEEREATWKSSHGYYYCDACRLRLIEQHFFHPDKLTPYDNN